eukprot:11300560-Alexandrium_andersonii.AAC.1
MSASLVGSEMCIRDRQGARAGAHPLGEAGGGTDRHRRVAARPGAEECWDCLLYTSDAADDM